MKSFPELNAQFPALQQQAHGQPLVYLDNAATTQKPECVIEAVDRYYRESNANVHRASHYLSGKATRAFEEAREKVKLFLNAGSSDEVIWTRGATEALNLVAQSWGRSQLKQGDEILLSAMEHHANIVPWQLVAEQTGAVIKVIAVTEQGELDLGSFRDQLNSRTRLLAVTHVSNAIGTINPVELLIREAKAIGAKVLIDGAQAVAHTRVDVQALDCDFYVFSGHKVFGPTGIGVLYGKKELLEVMPPWQSGGEMIKKVSFSGTSFNTLPFKFEAGTPNIAGVIGLAAALEFVTGLDMAEVSEHENKLRLKTEQELSLIPEVRLIGTASSKASVVSFLVEGFHNQDIGLLLDQQGVAVRTGHHCTMPLMEHLGLPGTVRASFSIYNTEEDVERFVNALKKVINHETVASNELEVLPAIFDEMPGEEGSELSKQVIEERLLKIRNWQDKYRQIMLMGKVLPALPDRLKNDDNRLHGCESNVWLHHFYDEETLSLHFAADSDARVIRGLIAIVLSAVNGLKANDISESIVNQWLNRLGLMEHLSPSRGNGLRAIISEVDSIAHRYC
ncbi:SufS family cysteine desulfurase [Endozoicomonas sp. OPT23]|uniref:SufS family cysteine desulfurase n=1 Tax=Endozoicomonas sp. OPT23 TaxID=2072845 RepID=UPI00129AA73B|nr:SufS family cysteine desulfurase [Endozoicomonas sp. OPT23]MRI31884.1 SufS family cysteine desulfurase [Endozoicomonas sp. OPT23]